MVTSQEQAIKSFLIHFYVFATIHPDTTVKQELYNDIMFQLWSDGQQVSRDRVVLSYHRGFAILPSEQPAYFGHAYDANDAHINGYMHQAWQNSPSVMP